MVIIQGWDFSLNHAGICELHDGVLKNFWFIGNKKSAIKSLDNHGILLNYVKSSDFQVTSLNRLFSWEGLLNRFLLENKPTYAIVEDYALGMSNRAYYIGEAGSILRMSFRRFNISFRLIEPTSLKMYIADNGLAKKDQMEKAVLEKYGKDFSQFRKEIKEDLVDAFGLAQMGWMEYRLRTGQVQLSTLSEKEIRVFNRTSKLYPTNILGRDWIS